jgi:hypothetical protein
VKITHGTTVSTIPLPRHRPGSPYPDQWLESWHRGDENSPDLYVAVRFTPNGGYYVRWELSNASFSATQPPRLHPVPTTFHVDIDLGPATTVKNYGYEINPITELQPMRACAGMFEFASGPSLMMGELPAYEYWNKYYGPLRLKVDTTTIVPGSGQALSDAMRAGTFYTNEDSQDALCFPSQGQWGVSDIMSVGGSGITFGPPRGDKLLIELVGMLLLNRALVAYDADTGNPVTIERYPEPTPMMDGIYTVWPEFQDYFVAHRDKYQWMPHWFSHYIRQIRYAIAANEMWGVACPFWRRQVKSYGAYAHLCFSDAGTVSTSPGWDPPTISQFIWKSTQVPPHSGQVSGYIGRPLGWVLWSIAAAHHRAGYLSTRFSTLKARVLNLMDTIACTSGYVSRGAHPPWPADVAQVFEFGILSHGVASLLDKAENLPMWITDGFLSVANLGAMFDYYGGPSTPHCVKVLPDQPLEALHSDIEPDGSPYGGFMEEMSALVFLFTNVRAMRDVSIHYRLPANNWATKALSIASETGPGRLMTAELRGLSVR